ncbi:MAG TPA: ABC transporter substrate-binding protein, partial [Bacillota bacterium]|nr:ABC transporter substrate-binding protein [Bacillota bacterium]
MKKIITVLLLLAMCLTLFSGCASNPDDHGPIIRMYVTSYPRSLDPSALQTSADITKLLGLIYEGLTAVDEKGKIIPALATNWYGKYDEKDLQYKMYFELNETRWSDGVAVSADDVIFAWKRILAPESSSPYASLLYTIKNAKEVKSGVLTSDDLGLAAVDDTLLEVTFDSKYVYDETTLAQAVELFAETVSCLALVPLREIVVSKNDDWMTKASEATTNGPFQIQSMEYDSYLILQRSPNFRIKKDDKEDKYVKPYKIVIEYNNNSKNAAGWQEERYESGTIYYLGDFTSDGYVKYSNLIQTTNMLSSASLYFNTTDSLLDDANVRKALSLAIDRQAIVKAIGGMYVAADGYVPHGVFNTDAATTFRKASTLGMSTAADLTTAKQLLSKAGVSGGSITLTYRGTNSDTINDTVAEMVKASWESLGFTVTLSRLSGVNYTNVFDTRSYQAVLTDVVGNMVDAFGYLAPFARYYSGQVVSVSLEDESYTPHVTGYESDEYD